MTTTASPPLVERLETEAEMWRRVARAARGHAQEILFEAREYEARARQLEKEKHQNGK